MNEHDRLAMERFFSQTDEVGVSNETKARERHHIIRRTSETPKDRSFEDGGEDRSSRADGLPIGVVEVGGRLVGVGIHILNEDVYPLQSFEIYLRGCDLVGHLDLSGCADVVFVDLYRNRVSSVDVRGTPSLRILGLQGNEIEELDPREMPACQGIDIGMNRLAAIDVSKNPELVELYVNDNRLTSLDTSRNPKLKYLRLQNNHISELDVTRNPLLRHLYATGNPLKSVLALAPGSAGEDGASDGLPLELVASEGGCVGLSFNPIYNAQWKETGEWEQSYHAYPDEGHLFVGWYDGGGELVSGDPDWQDEYGSSRKLVARFVPETTGETMGRDGTLANNVRLIDARIDAGLALLGESFEVSECEVDPQLATPVIGGRPHVARRFDVRGLGNLLAMTVTDAEENQLSSFVLTPYCRDLPLFSTDYVYSGERRFFLIELYDLSVGHGKAYQALMDAFGGLAGEWADMTDFPTRPCWYDGIRPVCIAKAYGEVQDELAIDRFLDALRVFLDAAGSFPELAGDELSRRWQNNKAYSDRLIDEGGVSTDLFTEALGAENTRRFFDEVFFGPACYRP